MNNLFNKSDFLTHLQVLKAKHSTFIKKVYVLPEKNTNELVFGIETTIPHFLIKVYSTIPYKGNSPRDKGVDAIRLIPMFYGKPYSLLCKISRVNRTLHWKENLENRILFIQNAIKNYLCPLCGNILVVRKNKYKTNFLGCSNFPNCSFTKSVK